MNTTNKALKGLLGAVLLLCTFLCLTITSVTMKTVAAADDDAHTHPICGATHTDVGDHSGECEPVSWTAWDGITDITYTDNTAYLYLTGNAERESTLNVYEGKTLYLCLNGYSIIKTTESNSSFYAVVRVYDNAKFVLCDCKGGGKITHPSGVLGKGVRVGAGGRLDGIFIMYSGEISGNYVGSADRGEDGAGVEIQGGKFIMYGGKVTDNHVNAKSNYGGGGVCAQSSGKFIMYGGEISNNYSDSWGGGVIAWGGFATIKGGTISGNTAGEHGGGIITNLKLEISGNANITNNTAKDGNGGGIYFRTTYDGGALMTVSDSVKISGNTAKDDNGDGTGGSGGGIYVEKGDLTLEGGEISGNSATNNGGGIYFNGGTFKISGKLNISENSKNGNANNVFLAKGKAISVADELIVSEPIGVTTEATPSSSAYVRIAYGNAEYATADKFNYENSDIDIGVIVNTYSVNLVVCVHNWSADWKADNTEHWHECTLCKEKKDISDHSGGTATCTDKAVCEICNKSYGDTLGHDFSGDEWQSDENEHWKKCSRCDATAENTAHSGGTATCTDKAVCEVCSKSYGELNSSNHVGGTEIRDIVAPTAENAGHSGNAYCKGCNAKLCDGTVIPAVSDLSIDRKSDLSAAVDEIEKFLNDQSGVYTDEQKELIQDNISAIKSAIKSIEKTEEAIKKVNDMPAVDGTRPDDKTAIDAYEAAKAAYDGLSDDEKRMAGDDTQSALNAMFNALTAYDITDGNGSIWKTDSAGGLTFTVNGYHEEFTDIFINGAVVDKKYYEVAAGSTVITLKAEYLQTLSAETYTLLVQYTDGSTDGEDTFSVTKPTPPISSGSSEPSISTKVHSIALWVSISLICLILLIILIVLIVFLLTSLKKRKQKNDENNKNGRTRKDPRR